MTVDGMAISLTRYDDSALWKVWKGGPEGGGRERDPIKRDGLDYEMYDYQGRVYYIRSSHDRPL